MQGALELVRAHGMALSSQPGCLVALAQRACCQAQVDALQLVVEDESGQVGGLQMAECADADTGAWR